MAEGERGSPGSLQIEGEVAPAAGAWAGATFWPALEIMWPANLSGITNLSFWAKGDDRAYTVEIFAMGSPSLTRVTFVAGRDWHEYSFALSGVGGIDTRRVLGMNFAAGPEPGRFSFQIDEVRLQ